MELRSPSIVEVEKLFCIELENYGEEESTDKDTFKALVEYPEDFIGYNLKVLVDDEVIGFFCTIEEEGRVELVDIAVAKSKQGRGYGSSLLEKCIEEHNQLPIGLTVREDNLSAIALYKKYSFKQIEVEKNYYDDCDGLRFER